MSRSLSNPIRPVWIALCLLLLAPAVDAADRTQTVLHMLDYVGVDYGHTVQNGKVVNPAEYAEQQEFAGKIASLVEEMPPAPARAGIATRARELAQLIETRVPGERVTALTAAMRADIIQTYGVVVSPRRAPDMASAAHLYQAQCAACHGASGHGDGPTAATLNPRPIDFRDRERQRQRSVFGYYNTISLGVPGTAMTAFDQLSDNQRWALAFYVSGFYGSAAERAAGAALWARGTPAPDLSELATLSPAEARARYGEDGEMLLVYLRGQPQLLASGTRPLAFSRDALRRSADAYARGEQRPAYDLAVAAYLEGFELVEPGLNNVAPELRTRIETAMTGYRGLVQRRAPAAEVSAEALRIDGLLVEAGTRLTEEGLSPAMSFVSALVILLREGVEAILILAAIAAFLIKTGRGESLRYLHVGWLLALLAGVATWAVASYVIGISGANRELTEGLTALLAAAILLYVGFWLHNKLQAQRWKEFIESKLHGALGGGALWGISAVAFIAVYREIFETVLFYEALWLQVGERGQVPMLSGIAVAAVALLLIAWVIFRFSVRLPLKQFFAINGVLMFVLAVIFAGQGVAALQEAGSLPYTGISFPRVPLLGIYPSLQSLGTQLSLLVLAGLAMVYLRRAR